MRHLLQKVTLVVVGYGGWDDIFMQTVRTMLDEDDREIDIIWGFYESDEATLQARCGHVINALQPAIGRRVHLYAGVSSERALPEVFRLATGQKPAENLGVFLTRVELARARAVRYPGLADPWGDSESSLGDYLKLLSVLNRQKAIEAALYGVEYLLPELERQPVHSAPAPSHLAWVREAVDRSRVLLGSDKQYDPWLSGAVDDLLRDSKSDQPLTSRDRTTLLSAAYALCACLAEVSGGGRYPHDHCSDSNHTAATWAAKSLHASARAMHNDDSALWSYLTRRLTGGYDHLWRF